MKQIWVVLCLVLCLQALQAQDQSESDWTVIENCVNETDFPVLTEGSWDFPGTIILSYDDGVRGVRADRQVDYYIGIESADTFPQYGTLSPDGLFFVYPVGFSTDEDRGFYTFQNHRVTRTDGLEEFIGKLYLFPTSQSTTMRDMGARWLGNDIIYYETDDFEDLQMFNFKTGERVLWTQTERPIYGSPDGTRVFLGHTLTDLETNQALPFDYTFDGDFFEELAVQPIRWFQDSSAFIAYNNGVLTLVTRDGEILEVITPPNGLKMKQAVPSPDGKMLAARDVQGVLYVIDLEANTIENLCLTSTQSLELRFTDAAWSPDSQLLALNYNSYVMVLDVVTHQVQVLSQRPNQILGWADAAPDGPATPMPPTPTPTPTLTHTPTITPTPTITLTPSLTPTPRPTSEAGTCVLTVVNGANLRAGAGASFEKVGSAAVGFTLEADAKLFNAAEVFTWWRLTTTEWIREDFVTESAECAALPDAEIPTPTP